MDRSLTKMTYAFSPKWTFIYILIGGVCVDIAYGILSFIDLGAIQIALLFRMTLIGSFLLLAFRYNDIESWFFKGIILLWLLCLCVWLLSFTTVPLVLEINYFIRALYPLGIALLSYNALIKAHRSGIPAEKWLFNCILIYSCVAASSIILSFLTGVGNLTYGPWAFGYKSFFTGGNDIGLAMLMGLVFAWCRLWKKDSFGNILIVLLITFGISLIGSRAAWGGTLGITLCFAMAYVVLKPARSKFAYFSKVFILTVVVGGGSFAGKLIYDNLDELSYTVDRVTELFEGVSPRQRLEAAGYAVLENRDDIHDVFGQGNRFFYQVKEQFVYVNRSLSKGGRHQQLPYKQIEQDPFDLIGVFGGLLGGTFLLFHLFSLSRAIRLFKNNRSIEYFGCLFVVSIYIFHGALAGHAMTVPQVGSIIGCIYGFMRYRAKLICEQSQLPMNTGMALK